MIGADVAAAVFENHVGRAVAVALAAAGANVAGCYGSDDEGADTVRRQIEAEGRQAFIIRADTGDPATADSLASEAAERWGSLDIWVNNAGVDLLTDAGLLQEAKAFFEEKAGGQPYQSPIPQDQAAPLPSSGQ